MSGRLGWQRLPRPVVLALAWSLAGWAALELWRPGFFLTDDNLDGWMPVAVAAMRRLWHGASPCIEPNLFGGGYNLLHSPACLTVWNPLCLLFSPLALGRWPWLLLEAVAGTNLVLAAVFFAWLLHALRAQPAPCSNQRPAGDFALLSDRRIVWLALSYAFSTWALVVASSWHMFLGNEAALPLLVLGMWQRSRAKGIALVAAGLAYSVVGGHLDGTVWTALLFCLFAVGLSCTARSWEPLRRWTFGAGIAALLTLPLVLPAVTGFSGSLRSVPLSVEQASELRVGPLLLPVSFLFGAGSIVTGEGFRFWYLSPGHSCAIASCLAAGGLLQSLARRPNAFQWLLLGLAGLTALGVLRPLPVGELLHQLPLLRSLRWPFREILFLHFWLHLFIASRRCDLSRPARRLCALLPAAAWGLSLACFGPPSFNPMPLDRQLVFSGRSGRFWQRVQREVPPRAQPPGAQWIAVAPLPWVRDRASQVPFSLLGAYNYPALYDAPGLAGYSVAGFSARGTHVSGVVSPTAEAGWRRRHANVNALALVGLAPLRLELHQGKRRASLDVAALTR